VFGDGEQTRDFTYVADVVQANLAAMDSPLPRGSSLILNIGSGRRTTVNDLWKAVAEAVGYEGPPVHAPARPGDVRDSLADLRVAADRIGYTPRVGIGEGLGRAFAYYRAVVAEATESDPSSSR